MCTEWQCVLCVCRKHLIPHYGDHVVVVEFELVLVFVLVDFHETWASMQQSISSENVQHNAEKTCCCWFIVISLLCTVLAYVDSMDAQHAKESEKVFQSGY